MNPNPDVHPSAVSLVKTSIAFVLRADQTSVDKKPNLFGIFVANRGDVMPLPVVQVKCVVRDNTLRTATCMGIHINGVEREVVAVLQEH